MGTINLDYRSLYLHFEDGVWIYRNQVIYDIKKDFTDTLEYCNPVSLEFCRGRNIAVRAMQYSKVICTDAVERVQKGVSAN